LCLSAKNDGTAAAEEKEEQKEIGSKIQMTEILKCFVIFDSQDPFQDKSFGHL
jgi:hypothetical protein